MFIQAKRILSMSSQQQFYWLEEQVMEIDKNGKIKQFIPVANFQQKINIDYSDYAILPGLIDFHTHGCAGVDTMQATREALTTMSGFLAKHGVVGYQATTVTNTEDKIENALTNVKNCMQDPVAGAEILGAYMEGPFFTAKHRGAHPLKLLKDPTIEYIQYLIDNYAGFLTTVAMAPEKPQVLEIIQLLKQHGIKVMLGHGNADYTTTKACFDAGADGLVHFYNCMSPLQHREPGMVGAGLTTDKVFVELICDGFHVHPAAVKIAYACAAVHNKFLLITDAMEATGMPDGMYTLGEYQVTMQQGVVRTPEGALAGSTLTLKQAVFNIMQWLNLPLEKAWYLASYIPASLLGITDQLGSLTVGCTASFVVLDQQNIVDTWIKGQKYIA